MSDYYTFKLVLPSVVLTVLSFIAFFMDPDTGERLGFGITMILAMLASDITASGMMPVCNEKTFMDYLSQVSGAVYGAEQSRDRAHAE